MYREVKMNNSLIEALMEEVRVLDEIIIKAEKSLENASDGILRISRSGNTTQYYKREDEKDRNGKYIKKRDMCLVYELAQKEYDRNILLAAKEQREKIEKFLEQYMPNRLMNIYDSMSKERQLLTSPYVLSEEQYASIWENKIYIGKEFGVDVPEIYTEKGERVRSKSEKILADKFKLMNIPYLYECPLYLNGYGTVYPDFTLLNRRTRQEYYFEHFGRMDDAKYAEKVVKKIESYEKNGIYPGEKLLMTFETSKHPLNMRLVEQMIENFLQ